MVIAEAGRRRTPCRVGFTDGHECDLLRVGHGLSVAEYAECVNLRARMAVISKN